MMDMKRKTNRTMNPICAACGDSESCDAQKAMPPLPENLPDELLRFYLDMKMLGFFAEVVVTEDGGTEMFTDEKGYACSIPLPYGTYIVRETTTPHNYTAVDDFIVTITENSTEPQTWRVLLDDEFEAKLKITKKDDETKQSVLLANTEFKVYDMDNEEYVEQVTTYPTTTVHTSYFTDEEGYLILPENLSPGNYRVEEVTAPDGYKKRCPGKAQLFILLQQGWGGSKRHLLYFGGNGKSKRSPSVLFPEVPA